ncbi:GGDEF domain-containing protein [Aureimonas jatrophae]|uniref:diguanylate cyclase n=1 Tax=Aureimonas jatrophae TaxID=1166073 RepID=A0A1H0ENL4_9HYPH|nr:GGDEF domain-containing protein [Aureimonas jatrophae]MBB3950407.1 diguanylate cyclase (GGDEF)-like protein [Aureimonas jatrophae]SDN83940.1 diguanylate cyclase (GGDEF) domain-containing protein [Aureimonas jatrophae]
MRRPNALLLFRMGAAILVVAMLVLSGTALIAAWRQSRVADDSLHRLRDFAVAFNAFTALAAERAPSEAALAGGGVSDPSYQRMLLARGRSDWAVERLRDAVGETFPFNFEFLLAKLASDRARIDLLIRQPPDKRILGEQLSVIRELIAVGETAEPAVARLARRVVRADPQIAGDVNLVRLLASLEQAAQRLPSEVLPTLAKREVLRPDLLAAAQRTQQRILALWDLGSTQLVLDRGEEVMNRQLNLIRGEYFGRGFPYLTRLIERQALRPNATLSADDVRAVYEPTIGPVTTLRDLFLRKMVDDATEHQSHAFWIMAATLALSALVVATLVGLTAFAYRQVFRPLLTFRAQILAIRERDPTRFEPYTGDVPQLVDLSRALETLRRRDNERELLERERMALSERLACLASTDELTGLLNRRGFYEALSARLAGADRAFVLVDIDHFKQVNDRHGHAAGDHVLRSVGRVLREAAGPDQVAARYGGEEFALVLTGDAARDVLARMETLRAAFEALSVSIPGQAAALRLTASFGVALALDSGDTWDELARSADQALYEAKRAGRNRVRATNRILARNTRAVADHGQPGTALAVEQHA